MKEFTAKNTLIESYFLRTTGLDKKTALYYRKEGVWKSLTYAQLTEKIIRLASALASMGLAKGERVAILSENRPEYYITDLAVITLGGITVPLYINSSASQIECIIKDSGSKYIFVSSNNESALKKVQTARKNLGKDVSIYYFDAADEEKNYNKLLEKGFELENKDEFFSRLRDVRPDDIATIIYTSGTSTEPKGVMLSHANIISNIKGTVEIMPVDTDSVNISVLPLSHALEKTCSFYAMLLSGASIAILDNLSSLSEALREIRPTHLIAVPKLFEAIEQNIIKELNKRSAITRKFFNSGLKASKRIISDRKASPLSKFIVRMADGIAFNKVRNALGGKIRLMVSGGSSLPRHISEFFNALDIPLVEGYGLTEASPVLACNPIDRNKIGSVGIPLREIEIKTAEDGEILARGPNIMKGYLNNADLTGEAIDPDGWLHTGDIGEIDKDGYITITGRKKDIIVTNGGKKISPLSLENALLQSPFIKQCMILGEGKDFITALLVPDFARINPDVPPDEGWKAIESVIDEHVKKINSDISNFEKIRKYKILPNDFTVEGGELTPTFKLRRPAVTKKYESLIEEMYA